MALFGFGIVLLCTINVESFGISRFNGVRRSNLKMVTNDFAMIQKYKGIFMRENVNQVFQDIKDDKLRDIFINKGYSELVTVKSGETFDLYDTYHVINTDPIMVPKIVETALDHHVNTNFVDFTPLSISIIQNVLRVFFDIAGSILPFLFLSLIIQAVFSSQRNPMGGMGGMGGIGGMLNRNNNNLKTNLIKPNVSLSSWAGSPEVLEECKEVISYLDNKEMFKQIGAEMPKGILLEGPPGTGKTLLAKGIATETNSSFISISGSEFVELFVGMGAARVRELFTNARNSKPCVIFIDEIDAVGRQRGTGINMANDEREQTLNQILYEMDGFNNNDDILVLAATNRKDVLDQALLRPGRFDRIIRVPLPDKFSREKILEFYLNAKPVEKTIDIKSLAEITDGFSGAQLKNLINEAAIMSAKQNLTMIAEQSLFNSFEKLIVGLVKKNNDVSINTKQRVAIHESGHAVLALLFDKYFQLQKVSIQATYNGAGGYTIFTENPEIKEGGLYTRDMLKKRLIVTLGGKAAEYLYYGEDFVSLGAVEDLRQANKLAQRMIGNFGMGDKLEVFFNENVNDDSPFLGRSLAMGSSYSDNTRNLVDNETLSLVVEAYNDAKYYLQHYKDHLIDMSHLLMNQTVLNQKEIQTFKDCVVLEI